MHLSKLFTPSFDLPALYDERRFALFKIDLIDSAVKICICQSIQMLIDLLTLNLQNSIDLLTLFDGVSFYLPC